MKILAVIGTRPESIKVAPVILAAKQQPDIQIISCATGQHRELVDEVLAFFDLNPEYRLNVMQENQDLAQVTARVLSQFREILVFERPDLVAVQGDTVSAFSAALASFYERVPVGHIEAGLRTYDVTSPFPEEALRQMITRLSSLHFAATQANQQVLIREGVRPDNIHLCGNTVIDSLLLARQKVSMMPEKLLMSIPSRTRERVLAAERVVLITGHRRENFGDGLANICRAIRDSAFEFPDVLFCYPIHPNPNVLQPVQKLLAGLKNVVLLPPLGYPDFVYLLSKCELVITDSGGVQEEAPAMGKPVIVTRKKTERHEAVHNGQALLAGTSSEQIHAYVSELLTRKDKYAQMASGQSPYGDGRAAERILSSIRKFLGSDREANLSLPIAECCPPVPSISAHSLR